MQDDGPGATHAASETTEQTTAWARDLAAMLIGQGLQWSARAPELLGQAQQAVEGVMAGLTGNREMVTEVAAEQVDRAVGRLGLVQQDELAALRSRLERLEERVRSLEAQVTSPEPSERLGAQGGSRDWSTNA